MSYIKKLVMYGFKSFPRKTEIPFTPGINVILGPNGSGKSNISDAICFVLGRLSIKSMRAAKAGNLIFLGTKEASPSKEASVEIVLDNSEKSFSLEEKEISIKRIVRRNGQSIYRINNQTKTRQEVLTLLAQAGIDPKGFNIILQGEIQNFVRMHPEERRKIIEEVSGISIYESRKQKSLHELEKTDDRLKEISSILRERTAHLSNLEKERKQALRYKQLQHDVKKIKASIINYDLRKKEKNAEQVILKIERQTKDLEKIKQLIISEQADIQSMKLKIDSINSDMQKETGLEQEKLNLEIANIRADLAGLNVKFENSESKLEEFIRQKKDIEESISESEKDLKNLGTPSSSAKTLKELGAKKQKLEQFEEEKKKFYMLKSELKSINELLNDKINIFQSYTQESDFLLKQIESLSIEIFDKKSSKEKLEKLKISVAEKRESLKILLGRENGLEKTNYSNEIEIENQRKLIEKISKMDICPVCKHKITPVHLEEIKSEIHPLIEKLSKQVENADIELRKIYSRKDILEKDLEQISKEISQTESDLEKISIIEDRKIQIKNLQEKIDKINSEISGLKQRKSRVQDNSEKLSGIEKKYENLRIEIEEISLRTKENVSSEISFKKREIERLRISMREISRNESDLKEETERLKKLKVEKESVLKKKRELEEILSVKFKKLISQKDIFQGKIRDKEIEINQKQNELHNFEQEINESKIEKARIDAELENLKTEILEFEGVEIINSSKELLSQRLAKIQEILVNIGSVNLRSLEVYDSIKKEYDSIKEKSEVISKEKESILKIISEIDLKKKKTFLQTLSKLDEFFSRNFSHLSSKGQVYLELENKKEPFEGGVNIVVKTGHGKYFDVKSLSGGEQTLVALSLIFSIQEYRPYYFYLLDEIDAALDKRNSQRLAQLLSKYMQNGQYIVISHNDEVISNATNLYGVSMHDGVSKIISLKI